VRRGRPTLASAAAALAIVTGFAAGCASSGSGHAGSTGTAPPVVSAAELRSYVQQVEAVRLPVNALLERADPILEAAHDKKISPAVASGRMSTLEQEFADYTTQINALEPSNPTLAKLNAPYAHTYIYEDAYLATLASDLSGGDFDNLPDTQGAQRLAIIEWRTQLEILAKKAGVTLPADIQEAGRGEIAPSPEGS
jgi:hypothetical protein